MQRERMSSTVESSPATPRTKPPELLSAHLIGRPHAVHRFPLLLIRPPPGTARSSRVALSPPPPVLPDNKILVCSGSVSPPQLGCPLLRHTHLSLASMRDVQPKI